MPNFSQIPLISPFKFVPNTTTPGIHFDDDISSRRIKPFEVNAFYIQKWLRGITTKLQIESTVAPQDLKVYDRTQEVVKSIPWTNVAPGLTSQIWECVFDISDKPEDIYWLYQKCQIISYNAEWISEPISSKDTHPFVKTFTYGHHENDFDVIWSTGIEMTFCVEAEIMNPAFKADRTTYADQVRDIFVLRGVPYRVFKLEVGDVKGVAPYILDILNRIFCCSTISINGKEYSPNDGTEWEQHSVKGYPLVGGTLEIVEGQNLYSIQHNDLTELAPGVVTAYNLDTNFFGIGTNVPITDIN